MNLLKDRYVDGLWENDIYRGLLWHATGDITEASSCKAPSWSWASVDGTVSFFPLLELRWDVMAKIHEIESTVRNETTGAEVSGGEASGCEVSCGYIRITGQLLKLKIDNIPVNVSSMIRLQRRWDLSADDPLNIVFSSYQQIGTRADMMIRHSNPEFRHKRELVIMPLAHHAYDEKEWVTVYGLVLSLQPGRPGYYKKVGVYETSRLTEAGMFWLRNYPRPIEPHYYQEFCGMGGYTVTIL